MIELPHQELNVPLVSFPCRDVAHNPDGSDRQPCGTRFHPILIFQPPDYAIRHHYAELEVANVLGIEVGAACNVLFEPWAVLRVYAGAQKLPGWGLARFDPE